jgi:hypothetical protein
LKGTKTTILGKLPYFSLGTLEFGQTYGIVEKTYQVIVDQNFILEGIKILDILQEKGHSTRQSTNQGF